MRLHATRLRMQRSPGGFEGRDLATLGAFEPDGLPVTWRVGRRRARVDAQRQAGPWGAIRFLGEVQRLQ